MCFIDDVGNSQVIQETIVSARKSHRCRECGKTIQKGEQYERYVGTSDGDIFRVKTCLFCVQAKEWLSRECGGYVFGKVLEDLEDHWQESPQLRSLKLGKLIVAMRRRAS